MNYDKMTAAEVLYMMFMESEKTAPDVASEMGYNSVNTFYKQLEPSENGTALKATDPVPFMNSLNDNTVLHYLAHKRGGLFVKLPRVPRSKKDAMDMIHDYQGLTTKAVQLLMKYYSDPVEEIKDELLALLDSVARESISIHKAVKKGNQLTLFQED